MASHNLRSQEEAPASDGGRSLFKGLKFWLARRLYNRNEIIHLIKNHGGIVVRLEQDANMLIADKVREDAPAGSYSFEFILDSVTNGAIQITDRYRIGPDPGLPKPKGAGRSTNTRTEFTQADDAALATWVLEHTENLLGNVLWQEFASSHLNHPWQSWRNRYSKRFSRLTTKQLEALAANAGPSVNSQSDAAARSSPTCQNGAVARSTPSAGQAHPRADVARQEQSSPTKQGALRARIESVEIEVEVEEQNVDQSLIQDVASDPEEITEKESFYNDLQLYADATGKDIEREYIISGRVFEVWDLDEAVSKQNVPREDVDWTQVAKDLGYDQREESQVAPKIQRYFQNNLEEFCRELENFDEESETQDGEGPRRMDLDQKSEASAFILSAGRSSPILGFAPFPPPSRALSPSKRRSDAPAQFSKRRRLGRDAEIPSTPKTDTRPSSGRRTNDIPSPTRQAAPAQSTFPAGRQTASSRGVVQVTPEQQSCLLRQARQEKRPASSSSSSDPFTSSPEPPANRPREGQQFEMQDVSGPNRDPAEEVIIPSSPSTLPGRPGFTKRSLPAVYQQREPPTPTRPRPSTQASAPSRNASDRASIAATQTIEPSMSKGFTNYWRSQGCSATHIRKAMMCTSMVHQEADAVIKRLHNGFDVPDDVAGVWTETDDKNLKFVQKYLAKRSGGKLSKEAALYDEEARERRERLLRKHGRQSFEFRKTFLSSAAAVEKRGK